MDRLPIRAIFCIPVLACLSVPVTTAMAAAQDIDDPGVHLVEPERPGRAPAVPLPIVPKAGATCAREVGTGISGDACPTRRGRAVQPEMDEAPGSGYEAGIHVEDRASRIPDRRGR